MLQAHSQALSGLATDHLLTPAVPLDHLCKAMDSPPERPRSIQSVKKKTDRTGVFGVLQCVRYAPGRQRGSVPVHTYGSYLILMKQPPKPDSCIAHRLHSSRRPAFFL